MGGFHRRSCRSGFQPTGHLLSITVSATTRPIHRVLLSDCPEL
jgi:hypothetical protein